jgi:hypothetical protein
MTADLIYYGNIIFNRTKSLSITVNRELLEPISKWIDDPDFMKKHAVILDNEAPNWSEYKRQQRQWTQQQKLIAAQRLKLYRQDIRKRKKHRQYINSLIPRGSPKGSPQLNPSSDFLSSIITPFSPIEQTRQETLRLFDQARAMTLSNRLPYRILITDELTESKNLNELTSYTDKKQDKIAKLQNLLQMEMEGKIKLNQEMHCGDITIEPVDIDREQSITIKDQQGETYHFDWQDLSDAQRNKVIADIKDNRILCKVI